MAQDFDPKSAVPESVAHLWDPFLSDLEVLSGASTADQIHLFMTLGALARLWTVSEAITEGELLAEGSTGQQRISPLIQEEARLRLEVQRNLRSLGLLRETRPESVRVESGRLQRRQSRPATQEEFMDSVLPRIYED